MKENQHYPSSGYAWYVVIVLYLTYTLSFYYFADDKMVRSSAVIVGFIASVLGLITLALGLRAYERAAEENNSTQHNIGGL